MKNTHGGVLILVTLQAKACNFTKINTISWVFFTFFKLYKWYQIAQRITLLLSINLIYALEGDYIGLKLQIGNLKVYLE